MANRPVFLPLPSGTALVRTINVEFTWHAGLAVSQKQKSIDSLHAAARTRLSISSVLEISSKSRDRLGIALSAFNLHLQHAGRSVPIEILFQSSKRFEKGGPYSDLLNVLPFLLPFSAFVQVILVYFLVFQVHSLLKDGSFYSYKNLLKLGL